MGFGEQMSPITSPPSHHEQHKNPFFSVKYNSLQLDEESDEHNINPIPNLNPTTFFIRKQNLVLQGM